MGCGASLRSGRREAEPDKDEEKARKEQSAENKTKKENSSEAEQDKEDEKSKEGKNEASQRYRNPEVLHELLVGDGVKLLKAAFLIKWWEETDLPLPCRQQLPLEAFIDISAMSAEEKAKLVVVSVSYCWLTPEHPDPQRYYLHLIAAMLRNFRDSSYESAEQDHYFPGGGGTFKAMLLGQGKRFGGCPVGVFFDWTALYQNKPKARTEYEQAVFEQALKNINVWYAHRDVVVWMLTSMPDGTKRPNYNESGWTTFEESVAGILKPDTDLLRIDASMRDEILRGVYAKNYIGLSIKAMGHGRVPVTKEAFEEIIETKKVTNGADTEKILKPKYRKTFDDLVPSLLSMELDGQGLSTGDAEKLLEIIACHAHRLETLSLKHNGGISMPLEAFSGIVSLKRLRLALTGISGDIRGLQSLADLTELDLDFTKATGDAELLRPLVNLQQLCLGSTEITGAADAFRPLVNLRGLYLANTKINGDAKAFQHLVRLRALDLRSTDVHGKATAFRPLVNLENLYLASTKVTGAADAFKHLVHLEQLTLRNTSVHGTARAFRPLVNLQKLSLDNTKITGDAGAFQPLLRLEQLSLTSTGVHGDAAAFRPLTNLRELYLENTKITGAADAFQPLVRLENLDLDNTFVQGDVTAFRPLVNLKNLYLTKTKITGDAKALLEELAAARP